MIHKPALALALIVLTGCTQTFLAHPSGALRTTYPGFVISAYPGIGYPPAQSWWWPGAPGYILAGGPYPHCSPYWSSFYYSP